MSETHTLGPWSIDGSFDDDCTINVVDPSGESVIELSPSAGSSTWDEEGIAIARLMVAAPDLLAALRLTLAYFKDEAGEMDYKDLLLDINAAIAKAEGR